MKMKNMLHTLSLCTLLLLGAFATSVWGASDPMYTNGVISNTGGVWYVLNDPTERHYSAAAGGFSYTYYLAGLGDNVTFGVSKTTAGTGNLVVKAYNDNTELKTLYNSNPSNKWEDDKSGIISESTTKIVFSASGGTLHKYFRKVKVTMAKHVRVVDGTTYGTTAATKTVTATAYGSTSSACHINLQSFLIAGTKIRYKISDDTNSEFSFADNTRTTTKDFTVLSNSFAKVGGTANCASSNTTIGNPENQEVDVYFTPAANTTSSSYKTATVTIYDVSAGGVETARATVTVQAQIIPRYSFKATTVATAGSAAVKASFVSGSYSAASATKDIAASIGATSLTTTAYYYAPDSDEDDYQFQGWYATSDCSGERLSTANTLTRTITSTSLNSASPTETKYYAKYLQSITPEFGGSDQTMNVGDDPYEGISYIVEPSATVASDDPDDDFWYEIIDNTPSGITDGSPDPTKIISFDPEDLTVTPLNAGTARLAFHQKATGLYVEVNDTITFTVNKKSNVLRCAWDNGSAGDDWDENMNFDSKLPVKFSSANTSGPAISVTQSPTSAVATFKNGAGGANPDTIITNHREGTVTWTVSQAEDYKYVGDEITCSVNVGTVPSPGCTIKLYDGDNTERKCSAFGESRAVWSPAGKAVKLYFEAEKTTTWSRTITPYEYVNGEWKTYAGWAVGGSLDKNTYHTFDRDLSANATAVKFSASEDDDIRVRKVYVTGVSYFNIDTIGGGAITKLNMPVNTKGGNVTRAKFCVDYGTCADNIKLASDHPRIKFAASNSTTHSFSTGTNHHGRDTIELTYTSPADEGEDITATITIYTPYDHETLTVKAVSKGKLSTTLEYIGEGSYNVNHANLNATDLFQVRDENGDLVASPTITLSSNNTDAINTVSSNTAIDFLCGADDVRITASYAGDETYAAASNSGTFYHDIDVIKLADVITWDGSALNDTLHVWADRDISSALATANTSATKPITFTSRDATIVRVTSGETSDELRALKHGTTRLVAQTTADCSYSSVKDSIVVIVDSCDHYIVWDQKFSGLSTKSDFTIDTTIVLTAYAVDSSNVATEKAITYTLSGADLSNVSIVDRNKLRIKGECDDVYVKASTSADDKYGIATASRGIRVRRYGAGCDSEVTDVTGGVDDLHKVSGYTNKSGFIYPIPPSDTIFVIVGRQSSITCDSIKFLGYDSNDVETLIKGYDPYELKDDGELKEILVDEKYRKIKIIARGETGADWGPNGGTQYKWFRDLHIKQKSYLRSSRATITNDRVHVYDAINETVVVSYSDKPLLNYRITGNKLTLTPSETVNNDCGDYGSYTFTVSGTYTTTGRFRDTIYITTTALDTLCIPIDFTVSTGTELYFQTSSGAWDSDTKWSNESGVIQDQVPAHDNPVVIKEAVTISTQVEAYKVKIDEGGSVTIAPGGGLTVGAGGISGASTSNFILQAGTTGVAKGKTGYLRISPEYLGSMPYVKVQMYSIGYYNMSSSEEDIASWQYIGTPIDFAGKLAKTVFTRSWIYSYQESTNSWVNNRKTLVMQPFVGYSTTQLESESGKMIEYPGQLIPNRGVVTIDLEYTDAEHGHNLLANSFAAPIDITQLRDTDFVNAERTIYLFNTGSKSQADGYSKGSSGDAAGQFRTIAIGTASEMATRFAKDASLPTTIAPMQGFCVNAQNKGAKLKLNYNKLVWNADYASHAPTALRAPKHNAETAKEEEMPITGSMKMTLEANGRADNIYLLESERYIADFEDGYDAHKMESGTLNIFTVEDEDKLAIDATNSIIGTRVGVRTGEETAYTITFSYVDGEQEWALYDAETNEMIDITNDNTYTFFAEPNTEITERFMIVEREGAPAVTTGNDKVTSDVRAHKFIKDSQLFILKNGVLYDATGARVK